jgi:hypothetical protein
LFFGEATHRCTFQVVVDPAKPSTQVRLTVPGRAQPITATFNLVGSERERERVRRREELPPFSCQQSYFVTGAHGGRPASLRCAPRWNQPRSISPAAVAVSVLFSILCPCFVVFSFFLLCLTACGRPPKRLDDLEQTIQVALIICSCLCSAECAFQQEASLERANISVVLHDK